MRKTKKNMTELPSKKNKKHLFLIVAGCIIVVGIVAFVLAYGLSDGWEAVGAWFKSDYAILLYILIGVYGLFVGWMIISERIKKL